MTIPDEAGLIVIPFELCEANFSSYPRDERGRARGEGKQSMSVNWRFNAASFNNYSAVTGGLRGTPALSIDNILVVAELFVPVLVRVSTITVLISAAKQHYCNAVFQSCRWSCRHARLTLQLRLMVTGRHVAARDPRIPT
ncbi:jg27068 [Pararge aegeria aegeria]|uniref:Jg27068 protein n=1 Tax=Pararge aegeria aegeria TaxID=348720 RepID=A0A8S4S5Z9_9NEOP|nr:jg27068 [Pararge aegeria aegeria]